MTRTALVFLTLASLCVVAAAAWWSLKLGLLTFGGVLAAVGVLNFEVDE